MDAGTVGVFIPIVAMLIPIVAIWTRHQQKMAEMGANGSTGRDNATLATQSAQIRALEDRVKVLERIVTDNNRGADLASQIEALRDDAARAEIGVPLALEKERV